MFCIALVVSITVLASYIYIHVAELNDIQLKCPRPSPGHSLSFSMKHAESEGGPAWYLCYVVLHMQYCQHLLLRNPKIMEKILYCFYGNRLLKIIISFICIIILCKLGIA